MAIAGTIYLSGCNFQFGWDLISQDVANNSSTIDIYGILNVTNSYVAWSSATAWAHVARANLTTRYNQGSYEVCRGRFTYTHDANGNLTLTAGFGLSSTFTSGSGTATFTLPHIDRYPILNNGTNFTDEENPVYNITAYNTFPIRVKLELSGQPSYIVRDLETRSSTVYTLELTEEERTRLRTSSANTNSLTVRETVCALVNNTEAGWSFKDYKMTIVNGNPVFSDFDIEETNNTVKTLTGSTINNVINVNGYSNIKATISTEDKATALKEATMSKYRFNIGDNSTDITYSDSASVNGTIEGAIGGVYNLYAIDSRNNSTLITKQATAVKNYSKITLNKSSCKIERNDNQVGENAILTIDGNFWNDNFGITTNDVISITYKLKKTDSSTWISGTTTITPTKDGSSFTFNGQIASDNQDTTWDLGSSYNVQITVEDYLTSDTVEVILNSAIPTLCLDKQGVGIMCAYDSSLGGSLQVDGKVISGENKEVLYSNTTGTTGNITLSKSAVNYDYIEIFYKDNNNNQYGNKVFNNKSATFYSTLIAGNPIAGNSGVYIKYRRIYFNGTSITNVNYTEIALTSNTYSASNNIYITKIIGYKE